MKKTYLCSMCGICGIIDYNGRQVGEQELRPMMQAIKHRGPDDEGTFTQENIGLGFLRLSILDLSPAGHQPMVSLDGRYVLVFNGEIFNYLELREELKTKGHRFTTGTDTEVLLAAWQEWGEECQHRFNGMWAFAVFDKREKTLFASRDRYGIKPFYYMFDGNRFLFGSEIPVLLSVMQSARRPNEQAVFDFLAYNRTDHSEKTFFEGVVKLQHGHRLSVDLENPASLEIKRWYNLRDRVEQAEPVSGPEEFYELFQSSVELRLRSDVPVGVCLSGGLDSSAIVSAILKSTGRDDIHTFSAVFGEGVRGDESEYIREYEGKLKNMHYTVPSGDQFFDEMEPFISAHAEPIPGTSPYAQFKVMKLASENVVVTLDGQGADELLAGYHYFFGVYFKELLRSARLSALAGETSGYLRNHRSAFGLKSFLFFLLPPELKTRATARQKGYIHTDLISRINRNGGDTLAGGLYHSKTLVDSLIHHFEYKLEHLLKWEDRNSMFHSLEGRVPFLDYRLVERTLALKGRELIRNGTTKQILRDSMQGILPEKIRNRQDKVGFATPEDQWFRQKAFSDLVIETLESELFRERGWVDTGRAKRLYQNHLDGRRNVSKEIWKWINLEVWNRQYFD